MAKEIDWEGRIGRRLRLRDLHIFFTAVQRGSMAKAAQTLGVTQPAVSKVIADLEHTLGVRLLDRGARGVEPTNYGRALLSRANAAFDLREPRNPGRPYAATSAAVTCSTSNRYMRPLESLAHQQSRASS